MNGWNAYSELIKRNCIATGNTKDIHFWRNHLFAGTLIHLLPLCLIALIPGLYFSILTGQYMIVLADFFGIAIMAVVAFVKPIGIATRKIIFLSCIYLFSFAMVYLVGLSGPGLLYLLMAGILGTLILPTQFPYWPAWLNTSICFTIGLGIWVPFIFWPESKYNSLGEWVAVSANLIFLSFLASALIPRLFNGLQHTIEEEKLLLEQLNIQQHDVKHALSRLELKNKELEQFAYVASHDLREPLRMVTSFMSMLKNKYEKLLDAKAHTYINFAIDGGRRMQTMIGDLLELSRAGNMAVKEKVDINSILKEVLQNIQKLIEENDADIIIKKELPVLPASKTDMTRLLQNLLSNAIKFRKKEINPVIIINAIEQDEDWLFSIQDNGIGIEKEKAEKIFEPFVRLHSQQTYEGTGIGLAVCKKVVEHYSGRIWIESEEGIGTTFYFTLNK